MKKQYKSSRIKNHKITKKKIYASVSKDRGHIVVLLSVRPSICLSVCTNLT